MEMKNYDLLPLGLKIAISREAEKVVKEKNDEHMIKFSKKLISLHVLASCDAETLVSFCNKIIVHVA